MKIIIEPGEKFGKWTVIRESTKRGDKRMMTCTCECGRNADVYLTHLRTGMSRGCSTCGTVTHGLSHKPTWESWRAMRSRCENPNHPAYFRYGGRGIRVCDRWFDFERFYEDMGQRPEGKSLERIDGNQGYFKDNCRWATAKEQQNNLATNRLVEYQGEKYTLSQLSDHLGMNYRTLYARFVRGGRLDAPVRTKTGARK